MKKLAIRKAFFFTILSSILVILFGHPRITIPLIVAYMIYLILSQIVPILEKLKFKRSMSIYLVFLLFLFLVVYPVFQIAPNITIEIKNLTQYIPKIEQYTVSSFEKLNDFVKIKTGQHIDNKYIFEFIDSVRVSSTNILLKAPQIIASIFEWIIVVPFVLFFLLKDGKIMFQYFLRLVPNEYFERTYFIAHQFNKKIGDYIFAKFIEATIVGTIITFGLIALKVKFAIIFGIFAGITNIIPYVGPIIGVIPAIIYGLTEYGPTTIFWGISFLYLISNFIDIAIVFPILISRIVNIHPLVVVISVMLGSQYFGILGMVISIPLAAVVHIIIEEMRTALYE